jgi:hypothetical protein
MRIAVFWRTLVATGLEGLQAHGRVRAAGAKIDVRIARTRWQRRLRGRNGQKRCSNDPRCHFAEGGRVQLVRMTAARVY